MTEGAATKDVSATEEAVHYSQDDVQTPDCLFWPPPAFAEAASHCAATSSGHLPSASHCAAKESGSAEAVAAAVEAVPPPAACEERVEQLAEEVRVLKADLALVKAQSDHEQDVRNRADMREAQMHMSVTKLEHQMQGVLQALQDLRAVPGG